MFTFLAVTSQQLHVGCSPARKMLRFMTGDKHSMVAGSSVDSPYKTSPITNDGGIGPISPRAAHRRIAKIPTKVSSLLTFSSLSLFIPMPSQSFLLSLPSAPVDCASSIGNLQADAPKSCRCAQVSLQYCRL